MRQHDYVEMTTTSIASSGAGAVTCIALATLPKATSTKAFGSQNTDCRYEIEDIVNGTYERGLGRFSSLVLTRTLPQVTFDGTTLVDVAPSALTFAGAGSPTSGNIRIRIGANSADKGAVMVARQSTVAGDTSWRDFQMSANFLWNSNAATANAQTADREYYQAYKLDVGGVLSGIQFHVANPIAASNIKMALYSQGSDGLPGTKIVDFVTTSTATSGVKTDTASASWTPAGKVNLTPGWYYIGFILSHAITLNYTGTGGGIQATPLGRADGYGYGIGVFVAGSYSTGLPAIPSLGSATMNGQATVGGGNFWFGLKVTPS